MSGLTDWSREVSLLQQAGVSLEAGLSDPELLAAEERCRAPFPPDLREFLGVAMPMGPRFPNWRTLHEPGLERALEWPFDGIRFDIEHSSFWWPEWGPRPVELGAAFEVGRRAIDLAPRLIPIYSHRYIPAEPRAVGNPVFSVYQTDVIYYGRDLATYFAHEFGGVDYVASVTPEPRHVRFWSDLVR